MKRRKNELNSTKIRYENELNRQNRLMKNKYDELVNDIIMENYNIIIKFVNAL